ncbi:hypothetical protein [Clostridium sp. UBA4548]|uniref:hypothetical protein n=1 Tax=Clostridium sp. UBA4548 TaxID=1946361 RepID=UPI0025BCCADE|nr:hypothetical protein [Clostridium sp. UBA4548]
MIYKEIESYSTNEQDRVRHALTLSIILSPVECVLSSINPKVYYTIFKAIHRGKTKRIKELEDNFKEFPFSLF